MNPNGAATPHEVAVAEEWLRNTVRWIDMTARGWPVETPEFTVTDPFDCVNNETFYETCWALDYHPALAEETLIDARFRWAVRWA